MAELTPLNTVSTADLAAAQAAQLSNSIPLAATATGAAGTSTKVAREDHAHLLPAGVRKAYKQNNCARILISSGNVNDSGLFTGLTALPAIPTGVVYVYIGDPTIGLVAGLYLAIFSSTTSCQLVGSPTTTAKAYTAPTTECTLATETIAGGVMGLNGTLTSNHAFSRVTSAYNKTIVVRFGGSALLLTAETTASLNCVDTRFVRNRGSASVQHAANHYSPIGGYGVTSAAPNLLTVNTAADVVVQYAGQLANSADWIILSAYTIEIILSPLG